MIPNVEATDKDFLSNQGPTTVQEGIEGKGTTETLNGEGFGKNEETLQSDKSNGKGP